MKRVGAALLTAIILGVMPSAADAQVTVGPTLAYDNDIDLGLGATLGTALPSLGQGFGLLADILMFFPDGPANYFEVNGNVTYDFPLEGSTIVPYLLGGINIARSSGELLGVSFSDTQVGLNLGGGVDFDAGNFRPSVGVRAEVDGGEALVFFLTLPFQAGG